MKPVIIIAIIFILLIPTSYSDAVSEIHPDLELFLDLSIRDLLHYTENGLQGYTVASGSMKPTMEKNDVIFVEKTPFENIEIGDIIVFDRPSDHNRVIVHRVVSIISDDPKTIRTQGDANSGSIQGTDYPITEEEYIGKVFGIIPNAENEPVTTKNEFQISPYLSSEPITTENKPITTKNEFQISPYLIDDPLTACINNLDTPYKITATFELIIDGEKLTIPAKIGFDDTCQRTMYTQTNDGSIYAEWKEEYPFELGHIFWIWGLPMNDIDQDQSIVYVDGIKSIFSIHIPFNDGSNYKIILNSKNQLINQKNNLDSDLIVCGIGTIDKNGQCIVDPNYKTQTSSRGGGCLIATATYSSELAPQVQQLRELRNNSLLSTESGTKFMGMFNDVYYSFSPIIADYERENPIFKEMVKITITPMISSLSILNYVDMDSESSVLGYGISLIMFNVLMYVGLPITAIMKFRKYV